MICLAVDFLLFIMLGVLEAAWIHGLISPINFGKFSAIIMSDSFSLYLSEFSLTCVTPFVVVSRLLVCLFNFLFILFFFPLHFSLGSFIDISLSALIFSLGMSRLLMSPLKAFFISVFLTSEISFYFLESPSLCLHYLFVLTCCPLFPGEHLAS